MKIDIMILTYGSSSVPDPLYFQFSTSGVIRAWSITNLQWETLLGPFPGLGPDSMSELWFFSSIEESVDIF